MSARDDRDTEFMIALTTAGSLDQAGTIARAVVERRLAACVNIIENACSVFWWEGNVQREEELLLIMKTHRDRFEELKDAVRELHSYDTPELIALPIRDGDPNYLAWLAAETAVRPSS